mgnify:CR=1 FL=1
MSKNYLHISSFLGTLMLVTLPAKSIQRFSMAEDSLYIAVDDIKMPSRIRALEWRGVKYEPTPNRRAQGWIEWNVAPDGHTGPAPIYGETLSVLVDTNYTNMHYSCCCIPYTQIESGHYTSALYKTQLLFSGQNPECVILHWTSKGLTATPKEDFLSSKQADEGTPLK